jgi:hypothetical protein
VADLLVGREGFNFLLEIKDGRLPPSQRKLTEKEQQWHAGWRGQVAVVESVEEAFRVIGIG